MMKTGGSHSMEVTVGGARCFIILMRRMTLLTRRRSQHQGVANENCHNLGMRGDPGNKTLPPGGYNCLPTSHWAANNNCEHLLERSQDCKDDIFVSNTWWNGSNKYTWNLLLMLKQKYICGASSNRPGRERDGKKYQHHPNIATSEEC